MRTFGIGTEALDAMEQAERYNAAIEADLAEAMSRAGSMQLLDIGAGGGEFARRMRRRGFDVVCVEPDSVRRSALVADGFTASADLSGLDGSFGGAYMINVLEHVRDDVEIVSEVRLLLSRDAPFFVWVPAFESLYSDFDHALGHYRRYSRKSLIRTLMLGGMTVHRAEYRDSLGWLAAAGWKIVPRRSRHQLPSRSIALYDRWIFPASRALDRLASRGFGKNVIAVATRGDRYRESN